VSFQVLIDFEAVFRNIYLIYISYKYINAVRFPRSGLEQGYAANEYKRPRSIDDECLASVSKRHARPSLPLRIFHKARCHIRVL
jgi:hypothetical protein